MSTNPGQQDLFASNQDDKNVMATGKTGAAAPSRGCPAESATPAVPTMRRYAASLAFLLAACAMPVAPPALRPIVAIEGPNSRVTQLQIVRIRTQQQMATWWLTHLGRERSPQSLELGYYDSPAGVPEVDFDAYEVVAVFVGSRRNSAGVAAIEVVDESDCRRFRYDGMPFQSEGPSGGAVRNMPYGFFVLPRTTLPIVVEEDVHNRIGAPREWQERAHLP